MSSAARVKKHRDRLAETDARVEVRVASVNRDVIRTVARQLNAGRVTREQVLAAVDPASGPAGKPFETWTDFMDAMREAAGPDGYEWPERRRDHPRDVPFGDD